MTISLRSLRSVRSVRSVRRLASAATWPVAGQQQARRNALVASTALVRLRSERLEVEEFLAALETRRDPARDTRVGHTA